MTGTALGEPMPRGRLLVRFAIFALIVVIAAGALATRLFYLQVARGGYYSGLAQENRIALQPVPSSRGVIVDRTGRSLVTNIPAFVVKIRPADLPFSRRDAVVERLGGLLKLTPSDINQLLDRNAGSRFDPVRIASDVPEEVARVISEERQSLPGVDVTVEARRQYTYGPLLSHLLGYTGRVSREDLERLSGSGYLTDDAIGKAGVEAVYESELRGKYGLDQVERDAAGQPVRVLQPLEQPRAGNSLELTIDVEMQRKAEKALSWAVELVGIQRAVIMVMNPQTGEILASVSLPSYDNNQFARGISAAEFDRLLKDPGRPLLNGAISEQHPPGSTYKLVTGTGGLADGKITTDTKLMTKAYLELNGYRYTEWNRRGWGPIDIYDGFAHSSDTFFYQVAGMLGIDRLAHWARQFGFDEKTGVDLPGEVKGSIPTNAWKQDLFGQPIYPGETYHAGIGQGYDLATPIQMLNAYAALANGGKLFQPQVVRRVIGPDGSVVRDFEPKLVRNLDVDAGILREMRVAARRVVTIRHSYNLVDLPMVVAGKTGTAEFGKRDKFGRLPFHSWFAAFVPKDPTIKPDDPGGFNAVRRADSELAVVAFAYDTRTYGNPALESVKYFLQLHYDLRDEKGKPVDLRLFHLMRRGGQTSGD